MFVELRATKYELNKPPALGEDRRTLDFPEKEDLGGVSVPTAR